MARLDVFLWIFAFGVFVLGGLYLFMRRYRVELRRQVDASPRTVEAMEVRTPLVLREPPV